MYFLNNAMLTPKVFLIVCPLVFFAGFMDSIAGGGALISLPAYLIAGIPVHTAIATNKLSASFGACTSAACFIKNKMINFRLGIPSVVFAILGSVTGAHLSMMIDADIMTKALYIILPLTAFIVMNKRIFHDNPGQELNLNRKTFILVMITAFIIGIYDGFFGPGAGTFTIICFTVIGKMNIRNANAQTKLINMTTTLSALIVFLMNGQVLVPLGIAAGVCNMAGSWLGAGLAVREGNRVMKPALLLMLALLAVKITGGY